MYMCAFVHTSVLRSIAMCSRSQREFKILSIKDKYLELVYQQDFIPGQAEHTIMVQSQQWMLIH